MKGKHAVRRSLFASFWEGAFGACMVGFTTNFLPAFALALKASTRQIGALTSIPFLASSLSQLVAPRIAEHLGSRRRTAVIFVFLHALMLVPILSIPFLFTNNGVIALIVFVTLFTGFNTLTAPVISSLMGEYIPPGMRGRYFGWRTRIMTIIQTAAAFIAGGILQHFRDGALHGFVAIFAVAFLFRLASWSYLRQLHEPVLRGMRGSTLRLRQFLVSLHASPLGRFALFSSLMQLCVNVASPFFSVLLLRELGFSYLTYTVILSTVTVVQVLTVKRWGACADAAGNVMVLRLTSWIIACLPLLWLVNQHPLYLVVTQVVSGFAWTGFNLSSGNYAYDATNGSTRVRGIGYLNVLVGLGVFLGALGGGRLAEALPPLFGRRLFTLFFISSAARLLVVSWFLRGIPELRPVEPYPRGKLLLRALGLVS